jgi:hypothetical protein
LANFLKKVHFPKFSQFNLVSFNFFYFPQESSNFLKKTKFRKFVTFNQLRARASACTSPKRQRRRLGKGATIDQAATEATRKGSHYRRKHQRTTQTTRDASGPPWKTSHHGPSLGRGHDLDQPGSNHPTTPCLAGPEALPQGVSSSTTRPSGSYES